MNEQIIKIERDCKSFTGAYLKEKPKLIIIERMALLFREHTGFLLSELTALRKERERLIRIEEAAKELLLNINSTWLDEPTGVHSEYIDELAASMGQTIHRRDAAALSEEAHDE